MKPIITWIVIANKGSAKIMETRGINHGLTEVPGMNMKGPPKLEPERTPGRTMKASGAGHHTFQPQHREDTQLAEEIAAKLEIALRQNRFDRLILCAAPEMLGNLRSSLGPMVGKTIHSELSKDLVNTPVADLPGHLGDLLVN
jgi:protein required for attachment to host cells